MAIKCKITLTLPQSTTFENVKIIIKTYNLKVISKLQKKKVAHNFNLFEFIVKSDWSDIEKFSRYYTSRHQAIIIERK